jgi:hypothetical protein
MKKLAIALSILLATWFPISPSASGRSMPAPYVIMVCNINGLTYNIDQNYGIYAFNGYYMGQLVAASTPSGWVAVRNDGVRFPVFGCQ